MLVRPPVRYVTSAAIHSPGPPRVASMPLEHGQRRLASSLATKKVRIVGEHPHPSGAFYKPVADWLGQSELRFERPSVRTHVDDTGGLILAGRRHHAQAGTQYGVRATLGKFLWRERGTTQQIHGNPEPYIA